MISLLLFISLAAFVVPAIVQQGEPSANSDSDNFFVHTVYFWLNNPDNKADRQKLHEGLKKIAGIDLIKQSYIGVPANTSREVIDSSYDFSITFIFDDLDTEQAYQKHPEHLSFVEHYGDLWKKVVVYDAAPAGK